MPQVVLNDILEIKVYESQQLQGGINVLHAKAGAIAGAGLSVQQVADALGAAYPALWKATMSASASYRGLGVRVIWPVQTLEYFSILGQGAGSVAGDPLPKQVSGLLSVKTVLPGRRYRGRLYLPFPSEQHNDTDTTPTAAYLTALNNIGTELITGRVIVVGADGVTLAYHIWHRSLHTSDNIVQFFSRDRWATQKRRGDYGKANLLPI